MQEKKYRHEYKYLCNDFQIALIQNKLNNLLKIDNYVQSDNTYKIRSIYFDDYNNTCYFQNESGTNPREKFRIRIYNNNSNRINLELKRKVNDMTQKEKVIIDNNIYKNIMKGYLKFDDKYPKLVKKLYLQTKNRLLKPVIIVEYERTPYVYKEGNVRITVDRNISSSRYFEKFFDKSIPKRPITSKNFHILEVKFDEFLPSFIKQLLDLNNLQRITFSKYYLCRKYNL